VTDEHAWPTRRGYCYHSAARSYKTETLVRKWREGAGGPKQRAMLAYELSFRDPALALAEVKARAADPQRSREHKTLRLCLHHVADAATARELFAADGFDPDALHLTPFSALLDDYLRALPALDSETAIARLEKLGFLAGDVPNPIVDGPSGSVAYATSADRYADVVLEFLVAAFASPVLARVRAPLAEHLRVTYDARAYEFLFACWSRGEATAIDAFAGVPRLGWDESRAVLGDDLDKLVTAFVGELAGPAQRFERRALDTGWLPGAGQQFPPRVARTIALAFLASERMTDRHVRAAEVLVDTNHAIDVLDHAARLPNEVIARAANQLAYEVARERLVRAGLSTEHPALVDHAGAPPDLGLFDRARSLIGSEPSRACDLLVRAARDPRHPQHDAAYDLLLDVGRGDIWLGARRYALHALGVIGDPRARPVLLAALDDPTLADARLLIVSALADTGHDG
jgi:hypothetical protein